MVLAEDHRPSNRGDALPDPSSPTAADGLAARSGRACEVGALGNFGDLGSITPFGRRPHRAGQKADPLVAPTIGDAAAALLGGRLDHRGRPGGNDLLGSPIMRR